MSNLKKFEEYSINENLITENVNKEMIERLALLLKDDIEKNISGNNPLSKNDLLQLLKDSMNKNIWLK